MHLALNPFQRVSQFLLFVLTGLVVLLFIVLLGSRMHVNEQLRQTMAAIASENSGLAIEIGRVRGHWWSGLTLQEVTVHVGPDPASDVLATVPIVQVEYTTLSLLGLRPAAIRMDVYHPNFQMVIGENRLFNLQPRVRAPHEEAAMQPSPPVAIVVHGGHASYTDRSARKPFTVEADHFSGTGRLEGYALTLSLQGLREGDRLISQVAYDLKAQKGDLRLRAPGLSLPYWVNRFGWAPEYHLTAGKADVELQAQWQDPFMMEDLKMSGKATLSGLTADLKNVAEPLTNGRGEVVFSEHQALLSAVKAELAGMPLTMSGNVTHLVMPLPSTGSPDQRLALKVVAPEVALHKLARLWPGLASLELTGVGRIDAEVKGTTQTPHVVMRGLVRAGHYGREPVKNLVIDADYVTGRFDLPHFALELAQGQATGKAYVGLPPGADTPVPYTVDVDFAGVELAEWLDRYPEDPLPFKMAGRMKGDWHIQGVGAKNKSQARVALLDGTMDGQPIQRLNLTYDAATPRWRVPAWTLDWGPTHMVGRAEGADGQPFKLAFDVLAGELKQWVALNPDPPKTVLSGPVTGAGQVTGHAAKPETWLGEAHVKLGPGRLAEQAFDHGSAHLKLADNRLAIASAQARTVGGLIRATGSYAPFMAKRDEYPTTDLAMVATDMKLGSVAALTGDMKGLKGDMGGRFTLHMQNKEFLIEGRATVLRPRLPGWVHGDRLVADLTYAPIGDGDDAEVILKPMVVHQGRERLTASGRVIMGLKPWVDLHVQTPRSEIATWFDAVQWADVVARLAPRQASQAPGEVGPLRPRGGLPGRIAAASGAGVRTVAGNSADNMSSALAHWLSYRKVPLDRPPPAPALMPFWEGASGQVWLDAQVTGPAAAPAVAMTLGVEKLKIFDRLLDAGEARLTYAQGRLLLPMLRLVEAGKTVVTAGGAFSDSPHDALLIQTHGLDLGWTRRALAPYKLGLLGRADFLLTMRGPWATPQARAKGGLSKGRFTGPELDPIDFDAIQADVAYERGNLAILSASVRQQGRSASISGTIPLTQTASGANAPIDMALSLEDANLEIVNLFSQGRFQWLGGKGRVDLKLGGTGLNPTLDGRVALRDGSFKASGLAEPVTHFSADVTLDDHQVAIQSMKGRYGGGDLELAGDVFWDRFKPERVQLTAVAKPFRLKLPNDYYQGMVSANLRLSGPVSQPILGGVLSLWDGRLELKEDSKTKAGESTAVAPPPLRLDNLNLSLGPNMRLKNSLIDVSVTTQQRQGQLLVDGTLCAPRPRGVVIIESGTIRPLNNPFKIVEGRVEFLGEKLHTDSDLLDILSGDQDNQGQNLNARLDVQARTTVYDYSEDESVNVLTHVTGSLDQMEMRFSSEPIRSEQEILDILSKKQVLAGTFGGKLDRGEVIVKEVGGLVTSNIEELLSPYTLYLRSLFNLQTFRFELVSDYNKTSLMDLAGFRPALTLETRPLFERLSLGSRLVAGEIYDLSPNSGGDNTYVGMNFRLNRRLSVEYRIDPYVNVGNDRVLNHTLGLRAQYMY